MNRFLRLWNNSEINTNPLYFWKSRCSSLLWYLIFYSGCKCKKPTVAAHSPGNPSAHLMPCALVIHRSSKSWTWIPVIIGSNMWSTILTLRVNLAGDILQQPKTLRSNPGISSASLQHNNLFVQLIPKHLLASNQHLLMGLWAEVNWILFTISFAVQRPCLHAFGLDMED